MNRCKRMLPLLLVLSCHTLTQAVADDLTDRITVRWPSREYPDLQSAIDAAPDNAILEIGQGTFRIDQPLFVRHKRLDIKGAGTGLKRARLTHLVGPPPRPVMDDRGNLILRADAVAGLWNLVAADVVIEDMKLSGFDAAIVSRPDGEGDSGPTIVRDIVISDTGRGILSQSPSDLNVEDCTITNTLWNGISVAPKFLTPEEVQPTLVIQVSDIIGGDGAGIYFTNTVAFVDDVLLVANSGGGIIGIASSSFINDSGLIANKKAGILLAGGYSEIENNFITETEVSLQGIVGDGIVLWSLDVQMDAVLSDNYISESSRCGVFQLGAWASYEDNQIHCVKIDILADDYNSFKFDIVDLGGNQCGCGQSAVCASKSGGPLQPPEPVGGLE